MTDEELERTELDEGNPRLDVEEREDEEDSRLELPRLLEDWLLAVEPTTTDCVTWLPNKLGPPTRSSTL